MAISRRKGHKRNRKVNGFVMVSGHSFIKDWQYFDQREKRRT
jgi:hypothetical protein